MHCLLCEHQMNRGGYSFAISFNIHTVYGCTVLWLNVYILICILIAFLWKSNTVPRRQRWRTQQQQYRHRNGVIGVATYKFTLERTKRRRHSILCKSHVCVYSYPMQRWNIPFDMLCLQIEVIFHLSDEGCTITRHHCYFFFAYFSLSLRDFILLLCLKRNEN